MKHHFVPILWGCSLLTGCSSSMPGFVPKPPAATLSAASLIFGQEIVGTTSPAQPVVLSNTGGSTLTISGIAASGDFGETNTCGSMLVGGATCTINVTFAPSTSGSVNGTVSVTDNATGGPHIVVLIGTGTVVGPRCAVRGQPCGAPQLPHCCPGLVCVPAMIRAFCAP
jgi:hypothetical protein